MKVIFLDFDGVLLPTSHYATEKADPKCVVTLNEITDQTQAKIVISSDWRHYGLIKCQNYLEEWGVTGEVIGLTPSLTTKPHQESSIYLAVERWVEIRTWLDTHNVESFVILDDFWPMRELSHRYVKTKEEEGLTITDAALAIRLLGISELLTYGTAHRQSVPPFPS